MTYTGSRFWPSKRNYTTGKRLLLMGAPAIRFGGYCSQASSSTTRISQHMKRNSLQSCLLELNLTISRPFEVLIQRGLLDEALNVLENMLQQGIPVCRDHAYCMLQECTKRQDLQLIKRVQFLMVHSHLDVVAALADHLIRLFTGSENLVEANEAFDKVATPSRYTWSAIMEAHAKLGHGVVALNLYERILQLGIEVDKYVYLAALRACTTLSALKEGRQIHLEIVKRGLYTDVAIGSTLIDMYAKCNSLEEAREVLDELSSRNIVSWGAMIEGYAQHGEGLLALECFEKLKMEEIIPDRAIFLGLLKACGSIGAIAQGKLIHDQIVMAGLHDDIAVGNSLVDMYARCGMLKDAREVLRSLQSRDVVSWSALIGGCAQSGQFKLALECFEDMKQEDIKPNDVIFTGVLTACNHAGLVTEGCEYFWSMKEDYGIIPDTRHYLCMIDLLARAGQLNGAKNLLQTMESNTIGWRSLLSSCRTYCNLELGRKCFEQIVHLDAHHSAAYVLMSGIYSDAGMWEDATKIEELRQIAGAWKKPAKAWIEVNNRVHEFIVGDKSHPQSEEIYAMLKSLNNQMKENGYNPRFAFTLQQMSDEDKEDALYGHCERLAVAFGLISTLPGATIHMTKNLRVCVDCHNVTKIISKIQRREIIIRDSCRTHHFKDGYCYCDDYF